jgi:putative phosphoesterase
MKLGIISDIHSNHEALQAVLMELRAAGVEQIINTGDMVGYSAHPNECIAIIKREGVDSVMGNYDEAVAFSKPMCGCGYRDAEVARIGHQSLTWTKDNTSDETKRFLSVLPKYLEFHSPAGKAVALHGGLKDLTQWITEHDTELLRDIASKTGAQIVIMGHTHKPFVTEIDGTYFVNPGAVGRPFDGDPRASYGIIEIGDSVEIQLKRVEYHVEKNIRELIDAGLPPEIGIMLRTGRDTHIA